MKRSSYRTLALLTVVLSLLLSSCFALRGIRLNVSYLEAGETARIRLDLKTAETDGGTDTWAFVLIGLDNIDMNRVSSFDLLGNWGGPLDRYKDDAAKSILLDPGECNGAGFDASDMKASYDRWFLYRSVNRVDNENPTDLDMTLAFVINVLVDRPAAAVGGERGDVVVFSGNWLDIADFDLLADSGEYVCTGMMALSIPYAD